MIRQHMLMLDVAKGTPAKHFLVMLVKPKNVTTVDVLLFSDSRNNTATVNIEITEHEQREYH